MKNPYTYLLIAAFALVSVTGWALWGINPSLDGTVKSIGAGMITVTSQSEDGQHMREVSFEVNQETKLEKLDSLNVLKSGDQITVGYEEEGERKIATSIKRQKAAESAPGSGIQGL